MQIYGSNIETLYTIARDFVYTPVIKAVDAVLTNRDYSTVIASYLTHAVVKKGKEGDLYSAPYTLAQ